MAIMMSLENDPALEETDYLLRVPANAKRLLDAITELENGQGVDEKTKNQQTLAPTD